MGSPEPSADQRPQTITDQSTQTRLAAIERHIDHVEALLIGISRINNRLDQIHATLDLALRFLTPPQQLATPPPNDPPPTEAHPASFRVVAHISRTPHGSRLVSDISWPDIWSVRLYVTALLRNLARSTLTIENCHYWCEVWTPDETGSLVDSAHLDPTTGAIDWDTDLNDPTSQP